MKKANVWKVVLRSDTVNGGLYCLTAQDLNHGQIAFIYNLPRGCWRLGTPFHKRPNQSQLAHTT